MEGGSSSASCMTLVGDGGGGVYTRSTTFLGVVMWVVLDLFGRASSATALDIIEYAIANKVSVETQFQIFVEAGALPVRPKKAKTTHMTMPKNIIDLVSMPPPPSPTKLIEEQVADQHSISPLDLCKNAMSEAVKEKFDKDRDLQAFIEKLPKIFKSVQKLSTKSPLFEVSGYQPGHEFQSRTFTTIT